MKRYSLVISLVLIFAFLASCTIVIKTTPPKTWQSMFGGTGEEQVASIVQTSYGYIGTGYTTSKGSGMKDLYIFKLDENGGLMEEEDVYGGSDNDEGLCIQKTSDGGYIVAGYTTSYTDDEDVWVMKFYENGEVEWGNSYSNAGDDRANCIQETSDGNYVLTGYTTVTVTANSQNSGNKDVLFLEIDSDGNIVNGPKRFGGTSIDEGKWIQQTKDGGYIIAGYTNSFGEGGNDMYNDMYIVKLDSNGNYEWDKTYGGPNDDIANGIVQSDDGNYVFAGSMGGSSILTSQLYVAKISATGQHNVLWSKTYGDNYMNSAYSIQKTKDGGYILAGVKDFQLLSLIPFSATGDAYVLKLDPNGNKVWERSYSEGELTAAYSVRQTSDGGYIVGGMLKQESNDPSDAYVLKLDQQGQINLDQ